MKRARIGAAVTLFCLCLAATASAAPKRYDVVKQFSYKHNPHGAWTYTYGEATLFTKAMGHKECLSAIPLPCFYNGSGEPTAAFFIDNKGKAAFSESSITDPPKTVWIDPEANSNVSAVWTAPSSSQYTVSGKFLSIDRGQVSHPVSVYMGESQMFTGTIATYGQEEPFSMSVYLKAGETLRFAVETNPGNYRYLSTGLQATITPVAAG